MSGEREQQTSGPSTTPEDLVAAIDATIARCFGGLDEADEAEKLGVPEESVRALRERLQDLRAIAARAVKRDGPAARTPGGG